MNHTRALTEAFSSLTLQFESTKSPRASMPLGGDSQASASSLEEPVLFIVSFLSSLSMGRSMLLEEGIRSK